MRVFRCYGTRSRAASSRRKTHQQVGSTRASPLAFSPIACQPCRFSPAVAVEAVVITVGPVVEVTAWLFHVGAETDCGLTMQVSCLKSKPNMKAVSKREHTWGCRSVPLHTTRIQAQQTSSTRCRVLALVELQPLKGGRGIVPVAGVVFVFVHYNNHTANPPQKLTIRMVRSTTLAVKLLARRSLDGLPLWKSHFEIVLISSP